MSIQKTSSFSPTSGYAFFFEALTRPLYFEVCALTSWLGWTRKSASLVVVGYYRQEAHIARGERESYQFVINFPVEKLIPSFDPFFLHLGFR